MKQILAFVLFSTLLCWLIYTPIYKHVLIMRQAALQKEVDYLLEIGASGSYGYIDAAMVADSKQRLEGIGFESAQLHYTLSTTSGVPATNPGQPIARGTGIQLSITYPYQQLFLLDRLIGLVPPAASQRMGATGMKMSEFVYLY